MRSDVANVLLLALLASIYPTLLAAVTVMLLQATPKRLMLGYLLSGHRDHGAAALGAVLITRGVVGLL